MYSEYGFEVGCGRPQTDIDRRLFVVLVLLLSCNTRAEKEAGKGGGGVEEGMGF